MFTFNLCLNILGFDILGQKWQNRQILLFSPSLWAQFFAKPIGDGWSAGLAGITTGAPGPPGCTTLNVHVLIWKEGKRHQVCWRWWWGQTVGFQSSLELLQSSDMMQLNAVECHKCHNWQDDWQGVIICLLMIIILRITIAHGFRLSHTLFQFGHGSLHPEDQKNFQAAHWHINEQEEPYSAPNRRQNPARTMYMNALFFVLVQHSRSAKHDIAWITLLS